MSIIEKWKTKREIKKILESNDKVKLDRVEEFQKDENLENIILSIDDKEKRAQAFKSSIHKIFDKEILKSIIPTLKDDDILVILENQIEYLDNEEINILFTTISGIANPQKRIEVVKKFYKKLSDEEVANLLKPLEDKKVKNRKHKATKKEETTIEDEKIKIITNKIIHNYTTRGTILHMGELLGCIQEISKIKVIEKILKEEEKLQEHIKNGEAPASHKMEDKLGNKMVIKNAIFGEEGIKLLIGKSFVNIRGTKQIEKQKKDIIINLYRNPILAYEEEGIYSYEEARKMISDTIYNEEIAKEGKEKLIKLEGKKKFLQEVESKDLINTPITVEDTGKIVELDGEVEMEI